MAKIITKRLGKTLIETYDIDTKKFDIAVVEKSDDFLQFLGCSDGHIRYISVDEYTLLTLVEHINTVKVENTLTSDVSEWSQSYATFNKDFTRKTGSMNYGTIMGYFLELVTEGFDNLYSIDNNILTIRTHNKIYRFEILDTVSFTKLLFMRG